MRFGDLQRSQLHAKLRAYPQLHRVLPGVASAHRQDAFVEQLVESIRRIEYVRRISEMHVSPNRADPASDLFDPLKAAVLQHRAGDVDEAFWLTFLATHCGRHLKDHWRLARDIYGGYGGAGTWTWTRVSGNPTDFHSWLVEQYPALTGDGVGRRFGNHRKYETLRPDSARGTSRVIQSYVAWVGANRGHGLLVDDARQAVGTDPKTMFDYLYRSMAVVTSFGRTGRFDFLAMVGKLGLANIEPGSPYLEGATGPLLGAKLLFGGANTAAVDAETLNNWVVELGNYLDLGMQAMEDAICNWQKSPDKFIPFRG
jgi:hypothetical protein